MQRHRGVRRRALGLQRLVDGAEGAARGEEGGGREDRETVADVLQLGAAQDGRAAALDHVGQQGLVEAAADRAHLLHRLRALDEQDVGPCLPVQRGAAQRFVQAERGARVGARDDQEVRVAAGLHRDADLVGHQLGVDHTPAEHVTALLREFLVLELDGAGAGGLVAAHRVHHVQQAAVAGVAVADHRRGGDGAQLRDAPHHVGVAGQARVRQAQVRGHGAVAGHVERLEAHAVGHARRDALVHARGDEQLARLQAGGKLGAALGAAAGGESLVCGHAMASARSSASSIEVLRR